MQKINFKITFLKVFILIFPLITSLGFYGYGGDFIKSYLNEPIPWEYPQALGWNLAGLTIGKLAIGLSLDHKFSFR